MHMEQLLIRLNNALGDYLADKISLQEIEDKFRSPIMIDDDFDNLLEPVENIVLILDSWEMNKLTANDVSKMHSELTNFLRNED